MTRRLLAAGCIGALTIAALAACTAKVGPPPTPPSPAGPSAGQGLAALPSSSPSPSPSVSPSQPAPATTTAAAVGPCTASGLSLVQLPGDNGAAGTIVIAIQLTNTSGHRCTISGYPDFTVTFHSASMSSDINEPVALQHGNLPGTAFNDPVTSVTLDPNGHSGFLLAYSNMPPDGTSGCDAVTKMHLLPPGGSSRVVGPVQFQVCKPTLQISPYLPASRLSVG
jgi:Protein of unknown function (DUF4232)